MNFIILGAGGIGSFYGAKFIESNHQVLFVARGKHLESLQQNGLKLQHPKFVFDKKVNATSLAELTPFEISQADAIIIITKSTATESIAKELSKKIDNLEKTPYLVSLQNGVENEDILCKYFPKEKVIGGLCRKIGAHILRPGIIEATGDIETIIGAIESTEENRFFREF